MTCALIRLAVGSCGCGLLPSENFLPETAYWTWTTITSLPAQTSLLANTRTNWAWSRGTLDLRVRAHLGTYGVHGAPAAVD